MSLVNSEVTVLIFQQADGFPTILLFPAGNKSFDPVRSMILESLMFQPLVPPSVQV